MFINALFYLKIVRNASLFSGKRLYCALELVLKNSPAMTLDDDIGHI
jgi:hypothetical protein